MRKPESLISASAKSVPMAEFQAIKEQRDLLLETLKIGVAVVEDFMPNIGRCALQDYGRLNTFLVSSSKLVGCGLGKPKK